ncbi:hypothetical protein POX41_20750, partial [Escherichia coli]
CDRRWMPNHDRFECQTAIDSDAILHNAFIEAIRPHAVAELDRHIEEKKSVLVNLGDSFFIRA